MATVEVERGSVLMPAESPDQGRIHHRGKKTAMKNAPLRYKLPKRVLHRGKSLSQRRYHRFLNWGECSTERNK